MSYLSSEIRTRQSYCAISLLFVVTVTLPPVQPRETIALFMWVLLIPFDLVLAGRQQVPGPACRRLVGRP